MKIAILRILLMMFLIFATPIFPFFGGTTVELFKKGSKRGYLLSERFHNSLFWGSVKNRKELELNLGFDTPLLSAINSSGLIFSFGIPAKGSFQFIFEGDKFNYDNFYISSGFWLQVYLNKFATVRVHPLHFYYSGYCKKSNLQTKYSIFYLELLLTPQSVQGFEIKGAGGIYYNKDERDYLRGRGDMDFYYSPNLRFLLTPSCFLKNELIYENGIHYGINSGFGVEIKNKLYRGLSVHFNLFHKLVEEKSPVTGEKGIGLTVGIQL